MATATATTTAATAFSTNQAIRSSSSLSSSSLTDNDENVKKFSTRKSISNISGNRSMEIDDEIIEKETNNCKCNSDNDNNDDDGSGYHDNVEMANEPVNGERRLPLIYQMNLNKNKSIRGTVLGPSEEHFYPMKAAKKLRQALNGLDTNEKAIIEITVAHNNFQRQRIMNTYEYLYSRTLMDNLKDELGGFVLDIILDLYIPAHVYLANLIHQSLCDYQSNHVIAVEIACTRTTTILSENLKWRDLLGSRHEMFVKQLRELIVLYHELLLVLLNQMKAIKNAYRTTFCSSLEKDILIKVKGIFGIMLHWLLCTPRDEQINVNETLANKHVDLIVKNSNGIDKLSHDVTLFEKIFIGHSWKHIATVIGIIDTKLGGNGHFIESQIIYNTNIPNDIKNMLITIVKISRSTQWYFAEKLHTALRISKPDYKTVMRIIVSRSEIDLSNICCEYKKYYSRSLLADIRKIFHGECYQLLDSLLSEQ